MKVKRKGSIAAAALLGGLLPLRPFFFTKPTDPTTETVDLILSRWYGATLASMLRNRLGMALMSISTLIPGSARELTLQEQIKKIHRGSKVMVQLTSQNTVVGCLVGVTDTNFTLELQNSLVQNGRASCKGSRRDLLFQDVSSIHRIREMPKPVEAIATVPLMLICGIEWIFNRNACGDL